MGTIAKVTAGGGTHLIASTAYGTCATASGTAAKVATIQDSQPFSLIEGVTVHIKFTNYNSVANPTLNVNGTGDIAIMRYGTTRPSTSSATSWQSGSVISFTYDGTYWQMNGWLNNNDNTYVTQTNLTADSTRNILLGANAASTATYTSSSYKSMDLTFNPYTKQFLIGLHTTNDADLIAAINNMGWASDCIVN